MNRFQSAWLALRGKGPTDAQLATVNQLPLQPNVNSRMARDFTALNLYSEGFRINSGVFGVISKIAGAAKEAPVTVYNSKTYDPFSSHNEIMDDSDLCRLMRTPNPVYSASRYITIAEIYRSIGGQVYHHMVRDVYGQIIQMYPYHASQITPIAGRNQWVEYYLYSNGVDHIQVPATDICVSYWNSINLARPQFAVPPLVALAAEVDVDNERARMALALLLNGATPAYAVVTPEWVQITQQQGDTVSEKLQEKFGSKNRGKGMVLPYGAEITKLGFSPKDMLTNEFELVPITRICEVFGYPIQLTSYNPGLKASTHDTVETYLRNFYGGTMSNIWGDYSDSFNHFFGKEKFSDVKDGLMVGFNKRYVDALRESQDKILDRNLKKFTGGIIDLNEAREAEALPPDETNGDKYAWQLTGATTPEQAKEEAQTLAATMKQAAKHNTNGYASLS